MPDAASKYAEDELRPTQSLAQGTVQTRLVIDAVNSIANEAARRMAIAALREHAPETMWLTRRGGYLSVVTQR